MINLKLALKCWEKLLFLGKFFLESCDLVEDSILVVSKGNRSADFIGNGVLDFLINLCFEIFQDLNQFGLVQRPVLSSSGSKIFQLQITFIVVNMASSDFVIYF